ncbi:FKBP-type peptidyl-prolyl cis-trans isomerase [Fodinibius saliphilus]|uniref:FKBP-type peptidyl-prolyl cis-trans isomerase n=1 Tax=Fodinibius saliphilus TaxID=1920650 RepID=UPI0014869A87|nr:FKBP-type peptidyl-prolyl cis-trans isomerase [Fodinibius saliphilus]
MQLFSKTLLLITAFSSILLLQGCGDDSNPYQVTYNAPAPYDISKADSSYTTSDGLQVYIIEESNDLFEVSPRDVVSAYYTGRVIKNGKVGDIFDSTYRNESVEPGVLRNLTPTPKQSSNGPISPLIDGFRRAVLGMREGEKRVVIIPPHLGYEGSQEGTSGYDLRNDTLRFDIEVDMIL